MLRYRSGAWSSGGVRPARAGRASPRSTGPGVVTEEAPEGRKPRRASARGRTVGGARAPATGRPRANGLSRGARLRSGRRGQVPASPKAQGGRTGRRVARAVTRRTGGLAIGGNPFPAPRRAPHGAWQGVGGGRKPVEESSGPSRRGRVEVEPAREQGPPEGGTALREGKALEGESQGRTRHETRPRSSGGSVRRGGAGGTRSRRETRGRIRRGAVRSPWAEPARAWQPSPPADGARRPRQNGAPGVDAS